MLFFMVLFVRGSYAQSYQVTENSYRQVSISFTPPKLQTRDVKTAGGVFSRILIDECTPTREVGRPELPVMVKLLEIPLCDSAILTITDAQYNEYEAASLGIYRDIYPAQPILPKSYKGSIPFVMDTATYKTDSFYGRPPASLERRGIMRDVNLARISISPVSYNPVSKKLRVYTHIRIKVTFRNANIPGTIEMKAKYGSPLFDAATGSVINPMNGRERNEINAAPIKYLIIAHSMFANNSDLNSFIDWKRKLGYIVKIAYTGTTGTSTTDIKSYIKAEYDSATTDNPAPTYLLLIGDIAQIPAWPGTASGGGHVTDLYYATLTSGDILPDCYYGRFSAQNISQLAPQIRKTLMYEQYTMPDPSYLSKSVLIAGTDATHGSTHLNGQINYIKNNYINTAHNFTEVHTHLYNCSEEASAIRNEIGRGAGWVNYTAHGDWDCWADPEFTNSHVASMSNSNKYGLMIGNCCLSGKFDENACFGETLLRATDKGALAYIGASNSSYWDEDFYWAVGVRNSITANPSYNASHLGAYDRIFHTHNEAYDKWYITTGGIIYAGNLAVESTNSDLNNYYWEIYHVFGDPSLKPYLGVPAVMEVTSMNIIIQGNSSYEVHAAPHAYVALTQDSTLIAATFADATGNATLVFDNVLATGNYELAVSAQNYIQYFKNVQVVKPEGGYVVVAAASLTDNSTPTLNATVQWNITLHNLGVATASNVYATISSPRTDVTIIQDSIYTGDMSADATVTCPEAFTATLPANASDLEAVPFVITVRFDTCTFTQHIHVKILLPKIEITSYTAVNAYGSTTLSAGDPVTLTVTNHNTGHLELTTATARIVSNYTGVVVTSNAQTIDTLSANATGNTVFTLQIRDFVPEVTIVPLYYHMIAGDIHQIDTMYITIGNCMETWENNNFTTFNWSNNSSDKWIITNSGAYAGNYCARSKMNLENWSSSTLQISTTATHDGYFSYYRKISSEEGYDKLVVTIDDSEVDALSGEVPWEPVSFWVNAGPHTYKFTYSKDVFTSNGSDCAWIDNIAFPGCGDMAIEDTVNIVGLDRYESDLRCTVYPNPTHRQITINSPTPMREICVFDISGRKMRQIDTGSAQTSTINTSSWMRGIYFIRCIFTNGQMTAVKFVKQ